MCLKQYGIQLPLWKCGFVVCAVLWICLMWPFLCCMGYKGAAYTIVSSLSILDRVKMDNIYFGNSKKGGDREFWLRTKVTDSVLIFFQLSTLQLKKITFYIKMLAELLFTNIESCIKSPPDRVYQLLPRSSKFGEFSATDSAGAHNLALLFECMAVPHNLSVFQCIRLTFISLSTQLICQKNPLQCLERCLQTECPSSTQAVI